MTLEELFELGRMNEAAYECTRQSRWKETTQRYLCNLLVNNIVLQQELLSGQYRVSPTVDFTINERGKTRNIEAPVVRDRIVQKIITKHILAPKLTLHLIYDNYASLPKRGTSFARKRFEIMLRRCLARYGNDGYILLIDIRKYFDNIDHGVLKHLIEPYIADQTQDVKKLIDYIIDTSSRSNKGLNLGSEAPQIFAIFYLNRIDTFVKTVKGIRFYGRYMDDIFILGNDKTKLQELLMEIEQELSTLKLEINRTKTQIVRLRHGFTYLQVKYNILPSGKVLKRPSHGKIARERRRLKAFGRMLDVGRMTISEISDCYRSWRGSLVKDHNACRTTLLSLDTLYRQLFPDKSIKQRSSRYLLLKEAYRDARDLKYIINN